MCVLLLCVVVCTTVFVIFMCAVVVHAFTLLLLCAFLLRVLLLCVPVTAQTTNMRIIMFLLFMRNRVRHWQVICERSSFLAAWRSRSFELKCKA